MSDPPPIVKPSSNLPPQVQSVEKPSQIRRFMDNKLAMLATLFFVTAALGLPFLWKSNGFTRREKTIWSIIVSIYTILILWGFGAIMWWSYSRITESLAL